MLALRASICMLDITWLISLTMDWLEEAKQLHAAPATADHSNGNRFQAGR